VSFTPKELINLMFSISQNKYLEAIGLGLSESDERSDAHFGAGWCLQLSGEAVLEAAHTLPDDRISRDTECQAQAASCKLLEQAVHEYSRVLEDDGMTRVRPDAAVNAANALCSIAELVVADGSAGGDRSGGDSGSGATRDPEAAQRACRMLDQARVLYRSVIESTSSSGEGNGDDAGRSASLSPGELHGDAVQMTPIVACMR